MRPRIVSDKTHGEVGKHTRDIIYVLHDDDLNYTSELKYVHTSINHINGVNHDDLETIALIKATVDIFKKEKEIAEQEVKLLEAKKQFIKSCEHNIEYHSKFIEERLKELNIELKDLNIEL